MAPSYLLAAMAASLFASVQALPTISAKGSKFFTSDGNQFYIKGVAYQLLPADPLADTNQCQLDAALMKSLGANAIRVYHVDPSLNHDGCMSAFANAGIYAFIDLDTFTSEPTQQAPTWTPAQLGAYMYVMDAFANYDNTAGFFVGNEIINQVGPATLAAPYIRAAAHDLKAYRDAMGYRPIPIGYSHADVNGLRPILQDYLVCGDQSSAIEFFGLNCYEWCGQDATYVSSGYQFLEEQTVNYPVPIFFSETGCIVPEPRYFNDQNAVFTNMSNTWSGAIIYEWIQESNHYGIITYGGGNTNSLDYDVPAGGVVVSGTPTPVTPDFYNLKTHWATLNPTGVASAAYNPAITPMACPAYTAGVWQVDPNAALPTLGINVAIPTASALALANYGLSTYSTPALGHVQGNLSPSTAAVAAVSSTTTSTSTIPTSTLSPTPSTSTTSSVPSTSSTSTSTSISFSSSSTSSTNAAAASTSAAASSSASSASAAASSRISSESTQLSAASSSANSIRSSLQSTAASISSTRAAANSGSSTGAPSSTTAAGDASLTAAGAAASSPTAAAVKIEIVGAGLIGVAGVAALLL